MLNGLLNFMGLTKRVENIGIVTYGANGIQVMDPNMLEGLVSTSRQIIDDHRTEIENINNKIEKRRMDIGLLLSLSNLQVTKPVDGQ